MLFLISGCEREPALDHTVDTALKGSLYQNNVVKLDSLVFTNPVRINGSVRFDLIGIPPVIKSGDIVYYPGGDGVFGKVVTVTFIGSRVFIQLEKSGLDQIFRGISIQDTISKGILKSRTRTDPSSWNSDSLELKGLFLFNGFWQSKSLQVLFANGKFYSKSSVGQFLLSGQGSDPWFDRFRLEFDYSLDVAAELVIKTGSAMDAVDSLLVERSVYGPFIINDFPVTYQVDSWLGFHVVTQKDTFITLRLSGISKGNLLMNYNYWESWKFVQTNQEQLADIQFYNGPRLSGYQAEVFVSQVITPKFCGEPSLSLANRFKARINYDIAIPNWQSSQVVRAQGTMVRLGSTFGNFIPEQVGADEILLYSESQNGVLENQPPKAEFIMNPTAGFTDTNFEFDASASSDLESPAGSLLVRWDFDGDNHYDTEFSTNRLAYYKYPKPGIYSPILEVKDPDGLTARKTSSVEVALSTSAPIASFTVTPESGRISDFFIFNAYGCYDAEDNIDQLKIRWDFDGDSVWDTNWSTNKIEIHIFKEEGNYKAKLEVLDTQGLTGSTTKIISVAGANIKPTAIFTVDPESGTTETRFSFDASGSTDPEDLPEVLQVRWDWDNDGIWDTDYRTIKTIQHIFTVSGTFTVVLEVIDTEGYGATFTRQVVVTNPNTMPNADFSITPDSGTIETEFTFDASISIDAEDSLDQLEVRWDWNNDNIYDTEFSTVKVFKRKFNEPGTYIVKLQVRDSGGLTDTKARLVTIE
ncbi:MAG: PKD domain-containing protein [Bacteroidia bacterium]|nr:PKD domain-containing protein [Bacteroidia bacterium]